MTERQRAPVRRDRSRLVASALGRNLGDLDPFAVAMAELAEGAG